MAENIGGKSKAKSWLQEYLKEWEEIPECKGWLTTSKRTPGKAYCTVCDKDLEYKQGGVYDLKRHADRVTHRKKFNAAQSSGDLRQLVKPRQADATSVAATNGVLKLAFFIAEHHIPLAVADHLVPLLSSICPDSKVASAMKAGRTKMSAAVHCVAEEMHGDLLKILSTSFFSIMPDESADVSVLEQVAVAVRVFDDSAGCVRTCCLGLKPVAEANAQCIFNAISSMLVDDDVDWQRLVGLCTDGANVMRGSHNSVLTRVQQAQPHVFALHCTCHVANLCAQAACDALLPDNFEDWLQRIVYFFERLPKRKAAFGIVQQRCGVPKHSLIKPVTTRWLSLHSCLERMIEQWDALYEYFTTCDDVRKLANVIDWVELMARPESKAYILFLHEALSLFVNFNLKFQSASVMVHELCNEQAKLHRLLLLNCVKPSVVRAAGCNVSKEMCIDLEADGNRLPSKDIVILTSVLAILKDLPHDRQKRFLRRVRAFYQTGVAQVRKRLPLKSAVLQGVRFLDPSSGKDLSARVVGTVAEAFPQVVPASSMDSLLREWQRYQADSIENAPDETNRYWHYVSKLRTGASNDEFCYPVLSLLAKAMLVLPHSNADIEREFSAVGADKSKTRNRIQTSLLNCLMTITQNKTSTCVDFAPSKCMRDRLPHHVAVAAGREKIRPEVAEKKEDEVDSVLATANQAVNISNTGKDLTPSSSSDEGSIVRSQSPDLSDACQPDTRQIHLIPVKRKVWRVGQFFQYVLPVAYSQSTVNGRSGSVACTVIASVTVSRVLRGIIVVPGVSESPTQECLHGLVLVVYKMEMTGMIEQSWVAHLQLCTTR